MERIIHEDFDERVGTDVTVRKHKTNRGTKTDMYKLSVYNNIYLTPAKSAPTTVGGERGNEQEGEKKGEKVEREEKGGGKGR